MLRSVELSGPAGRLEALLNEGAPDAPFAALVCHPHPLGGGTMHNKVVYHAMKALNDPQWGLGWPVLRFNFRGTGLSQGVHDGYAESSDVLAALAWLENEYCLPLVLVGFSFGAMMALSACCSTSPAIKNIRALALLGLPTHATGVPSDRSSSLGWSADHDYRYPQLHACTIPKLFLSGADDQFAPHSQLANIAASAAEPTHLVLLPRADHFFTGQLEPMQSALATWMKEQLP
jgi:alpha/beta superfamily hydrolase